MTDEQVKELMQSWRDALAKQMEEMRLRQWCIDKSIEYGKAGIAQQPHELLLFITKPFAETFKDDPA